MPVEDFLTDGIMWLVSGIGSALTLLGAPLLATHRRSKDNKDRLEDLEPLAEDAAELAQSNRRILAGEDGNPTHDGILEIVEDNNEQIRKIEQQMEAQGLTDIEKTGEGTIDIDTGETAETTELSAVYPFEGISFDVTETEAVEIPPSDIDIAAMFAVWHHGDFVVISGGAYPAQNFDETVESDLSDGITVSVDVDLGLRPDAYRTEVRNLVAGIQ